MNKITLIGKLVDAPLTDIMRGHQVATLAVALKEGNRERQVRVRYSGEDLFRIANLEKGSRVMVDGILETEMYARARRDGKSKRFFAFITAEDVRNAPKKKKVKK